MVMDTTLRREKQIISSFLDKLEPVSPIPGEVISGWHTWSNHTLVEPPEDGQVCTGILLTRYKDITYIFFADAPDAYISTVRSSIFYLLRAMHSIPMK